MSKASKYFIIGLIFPLFSLLNSCKEDTGTVGANILPKGDLIGAYETDTSTVLSSMYIKDSAETNDGNPAMLGSYSDPIFGQLTASIYTQIFSPAGAEAGAIPWADSIVDSAVLVLEYSGVPPYGSLDAQTFKVYSMKSSLDTGTRYYSGTSFKYNPIPIGVQQITPNLASDSLKIKLSGSWLQSILAAMQETVNGSVDYYYLNFDSLVKGLYITVSNPAQLPGQGGILYMNFIGGSTTAMYIYYHSNTRTTKFPDQYQEFAVGGGIWYTHVDRNYSIAPFNSVHPTGIHDSIAANNFIYVQSAGGVLGRLNFPNLRKNWSKMGPMVINQAEVDIPVDGQDVSASLQPPPYLFLYGTNYLGQAYGLPDQGQSYYGGTYNAFTNEYNFYITQYIQEVILGKDTDRGLYIEPGSYANAANRMVLYGAQHGGLPTTPRIKLKIYYTPLKP